MSAVGIVPLPPFVQPSVGEMRFAARIANSQSVVSAYGACEWDELGDDGKVWLAAVVREARRSATPDGDTITAINAFLGMMADRYRERTALFVVGFQINQISRFVAMQWALGMFEFVTQDEPFGDPAYAWDRDHADALVDEDMSCW